MFYSTLVAAAAFTAAVRAQNYSTSGTNLTIDPNSVEYNERQAWCRAQINSCPMICGGQASPNTCDPNTLIYGCTCSDGSTPNITDYDQTIPSFVCAAWIGDCVNDHPNDLDAITGCRSVTCGSRNASSGSSSGSSSSSSMSSSATTTSGSDSGSSQASQTSEPSSTESDSSSSGASETTSSGASSASATDSAATALNMASTYGTGVLAAGILAAFGLAL